MQSEWRPLLERFGGLKLLVIGEAMLDRYLRGSTDRLCREAPVPIVAVHETIEAAGGAANVAANAAALGAQVSFISSIGADEAGRVLLDCLRARGVDVEGVIIDPARRTLTKQRVLAGSQMLLRFDQGSTESVSCATEAALSAALETLWPDADAVVISDYGYGILTPSIVVLMAALQSIRPHTLLVDAKDLTLYRCLQPTAVTPNYDEAVRQAGRAELADGGGRSLQIDALGDRLLELTGASMAAVTLDADGAVVVQRGAKPLRVAAQPAASARAAGAGDSFLAALALALAAGADARCAAELAVAAASVAVREDGTALCSPAGLRSRLHSDPRKLLGRDELAALLERERLDGRRIVFTNGCFDIVHSGHTSFLAAARALGDVLVVGLNTDASVRALKGPGRPINALADRAQVLEALTCIDYVVPFGEASPEALIRPLLPDVFVKGGDYTLAELPEAALVEAQGGAVQILDYVSDHSTTGIIERIRQSEPVPVESAL